MSLEFESLCRQREQAIFCLLFVSMPSCLEKDTIFDLVGGSCRNGSDSLRLLIFISIPAVTCVFCVRDL